MQKIRCIIIDDEPIAIKVISSYIDKLNELELIAGYTNAIEAFNEIHHLSVDLIFLDIEMPEITGLDFIKALSDPPRIILTTAHRDYALDAFDLNVFDYLLKPVSFARFLKAIDKYKESNRPVPIDHENKSNSFIQVKANNKTYKIEHDDILFIESMDDFVRIHTLREKIITYNRLIKLEEVLPKTIFIRIHRSYIVNISKINSYSQSFIEINGIKIPVGKSYRNKLMEIMNSGNLS